MIKVAVTGAGGFIGTHIIRHLNRMGVDYTALERTEDDFIYPPDWAKYNVIIHLAARVHRKKSRKTDINYTLNLARKALEAGMTQFIFMSSVGVLGEFSGARPFDENSPYAPFNDYSISKMEAEKALAGIFEHTGVNLTIIRPPLVYGAGARGTFRTLSELLRKIPVLPLGRVRSRRSFCSVDNLCDLVMSCLENEKSYNRTFLVSDDQDVSLTDFVKMMYEGLGKACLLVPVPRFLMYLAGWVTFRPRTVAKLYGSLAVDISHTKKALDWQPPYAIKQEIGKALQHDSLV